MFQLFTRKKEKEIVLPRVRFIEPSLKGNYYHLYLSGNSYTTQDCYNTVLNQIRSQLSELKLSAEIYRDALEREFLVLLDGKQHVDAYEIEIERESPHVISLRRARSSGLLVRLLEDSI